MNPELEETLEEFKELEKPVQKFLVEKHIETGGQA